MTGPGEYWDSSANWIIKIIFCANGFITFDSRVSFFFFPSGVAEDKWLRIEGSARTARFASVMSSRKKKKLVSAVEHLLGSPMTDR